MVSPIVAGSQIKTNFKNRVDGLTLLHSILPNKGKARHDLTQMTETVICDFINELNRVITSSGHLFLWVDKFHLCQGILAWFEKTDFNLVDMIVWDKDKIGMGVSFKKKV